ncbi:MAG TPA: hypothetical protein VF169_21590 [Albitalea sp.]|uniref:hypothetical protein n=1 Tax=Piscinibacter sp. TaxID=1903157 RepID=UPI002ED4AC49
MPWPWRRLKTDREILRTLYDMCIGEYPAKGEIWVEVDLYAAAKRLGCQAELLYGRLYFDMGTRLRHRDPKDPNKILASVYEKVAGDKRNVINVPYVAALLATMEADNRRNRATFVMSTIALVVSLSGLAVQYTKARSDAQGSVVPMGAQLGATSAASGVQSKR